MEWLETFTSLGESVEPEVLNKLALDIVQRVRDKLTGKDFNTEVRVHRDKLTGKEFNTEVSESL